jgi:hypothetical protein
MSITPPNRSTEPAQKGTPIKYKQAGVSSFNIPDDSNRDNRLHDCAKEMKQHWAGPITPEVFLEQFLPAPDGLSRVDWETVKENFDNLRKPPVDLRREETMYKTLVSRFIILSLHAPFSTIKSRNKQSTAAFPKISNSSIHLQEET